MKTLENDYKKVKEIISEISHLRGTLEEMPKQTDLSADIELDGEDVAHRIWRSCYK